MKHHYVHMKKVMRNHWLVACQDSELGRKPLGVTVLDKPIVLFRTEQGVHALVDRCPHRNVPLSAGWVKEDMLVCPYHGWEFDSEGVCQRVPGLCEYTHGTHTSTTAVPVRQQDGFIWVRLSEDIDATTEVIDEDLPDSETNQPFDLSFLNDPSLYSFIWRTSVKGNLLNTVENFLDATHTHYIHAGLIRTDKNRQKVNAKLTAYRDSVEIEYSGESKQAGLISQLLERDRQTSYGRFFMPGIAQIEYRSKKGLSMMITAVTRLTSESVQDIYAIVTVKRGIVPNFIKKLVITPFFKIALKQDIRIVELQQKWIQRYGEESFHSTQADLIRPYIEQLTTGRYYDKPYEKKVMLLL
ncbi:aromatic ring-hydroxylating oxygenase subunit alpha [Risungbinella massiliensis]|uniref:aromatic ring-hydroxylating oxygenase subunit alpha n=1 Tax=Risungbinella massiliensis TaxID=1329796 RepID=UPI0005CBBA0E|nr:aromatic ring-hydroxylating dioxygenase subunit alpha [Risungbinella massiliensis]